MMEQPLPFLSFISGSDITSGRRQVREKCHGLGSPKRRRTGGRPTSKRAFPFPDCTSFHATVGQRHQLEFGDSGVPVSTPNRTHNAGPTRARSPNFLQSEDITEARPYFPRSLIHR